MIEQSDAVDVRKSANALSPQVIKVTIITSTLNVGESLAITAKSIQAQQYQNIEWIIVDGASSDNTLDVARRFSGVVSKLISEPDSGIYSAWNKALPLITGDWVLFLGAGDEFNSDYTLGEVAAFLSTIARNISIVYGNVLEIDQETGQTLRLRNQTWQGLNGPWSSGRPILPCHQGVLHRATLFREGFKFDTRCRISSDSEIMLRELLGGGGIDSQLLITRFRWGGVSSIRTNRLRMIAEIVYINYKVGILFRRPIYQLAVLASNAVKHIPRILGFTQI